MPTALSSSPPCCTPQDLAQRAMAYTRCPLASDGEVQKFVQMVEKLFPVAKELFTSVWDLVKIVSSVIRCALSSSSAQVPHLLPVICVGIRISPLTCSQALSLAVRDCHADRLQTDFTHAAEAQLADDACAAVFASLLNGWHRWECVRADSTWERVSVCSLFVQACMTASNAVAPRDARVVRMFSEYWLSNILSYGLRPSPPSASQLVLRFIGGPRAMASNHPCLAAALVSSPEHQQQQQQQQQHLCSQWRSLRTQITKSHNAAIREHYTALQGSWHQPVKELLAGAFSADPAPLVEDFYRPSAMSPGRCKELYTLATSQADEMLGLEAVYEEILYTHRVSSALADLSACEQYVEVDGGEYEMSVRPLLVMAMRANRTDVAVELLRVGPAENVLGRTRWAQRLEGVMPHRVGAWLDEADGGGEPCATWSEHLQRVAARLTPDTAIDVLVLSSDAALLRPVCDCVMRGLGTAGRQVLQDPLAASFLCRALFVLAGHFLDTGDVPLGRAYLTMLGMCVTCCATRASVLLLCQLMGRVADVFSTGHVLMYGRNGSDTRRYWQEVADAIPTDAETEARGTSSSGGHHHGHQQRGKHIGSAFDARRSLFQRAHHSCHHGEVVAALPEAVPTTSTTTTSSSQSAGESHTVVVLQRCRDDFIVERWHQSVSPSVSASIRRRVLFGCKHLCELNDRTLRIMEANRLQLASGHEEFSAEATAAATANMDASDTSSGSHGSGQHAGQRSAKERWWSARFRLDREMHGVVSSMENTMGYERLYLLGDLPRGLGAQVRALAERLVEDFILLECGGNSSSEGEVRKQLVEHCLFLLQGLPYLASESTRHAQPVSPKEATVKTEEYPKHAALYCPQHLAAAGVEETPTSGGRCPQCQHFVEETATLLWLAMQQQHGCCGGSTSTTDGDVPNYLRVAVKSVFDAYYNYLVGGIQTTDGHVDLLHVARQHVYLVIEDAWSTLPFEGMDVLFGSSCSRVPSLHFLREGGLPIHSAVEQDSTALPLQRAHFYMDSMAVSKPGRFKSLFSSHPSWTLVSSSDGASSGDSTTQHHGGALLQQLLQNNTSVYVYLGHKHGEAQLSRAHLYERFPRGGLPLVLLMGCRSAHLFGLRKCDGYGMPWAYLHAGAPSLIACLWDVTDGEIDKLTKRFFVVWQRAVGSAASRTITAGEVLCAARQVCKLPYLTGASVVLFGTNATLGGS